jgi:membrane protease YdiL (CAAX protease family)
MKKTWKYLELFFIILSLIILVVSSLFKFDNNEIMGLDKLIADIIITIICYILIIKLGIRETAGFNKEGFKKGLILGIPFIIIGIGSVIFSNIGIDLDNIKHISIFNTLLFTINMLFVGINEEFWMRGLILNGLMKKYEKSSVWKPIIISSLIFGLVHIPNIFFVEPIILLIQVINAMCGGILFATIFIKSRNIYSVIVIHALTDWISLFVASCFTGANSALSMSINLGQALFMIAGGSLPPILISMYLLRNYKRELE